MSNPAEPKQYYVSVEGTNLGPFDEQKLHEMMSVGAFSPQSSVWTEGMEQWKPYDQVFAAQSAATPPPVGSPPVPPPPPAPGMDYSRVVGAAVDAVKNVNYAALTSNAKDSAANAIGKVDDLVGKASGLEKLQGFSWSQFFSAVFRKHSDAEVYELFNCGTPATTPSLSQISTAWPTPWFFTRLFVYGLILSAMFWWGTEKMGNLNMFPGFIIFASLAAPFAIFMMFYELNVRRDVSIYNALRCVIGGGAVSLVYTILIHRLTDTIGFELDGAWWAGPVEEFAKLLAVLLVVRFFKLQNVRVLTAVLLGCAVGAGFAAFETMGYVFRASMSKTLVIGLGPILRNAPDNFVNQLVYYLRLLVEEDFDTAYIRLAIIRGVLAPLCHVVWSAVVAGAFFRVSNMRAQENPQLQNAGGIDWSVLTDKRFLCVALFPVGMHMLWNSGAIWVKLFGASGGSTVSWLSYPVLGMIAWMLALRMVQTGLNQVRAERAALNAAPQPADPTAPPPPDPFPVQQ